MLLEYRLSSIQRRKYIVVPLLRLSAVIVVGTIACAIWFETKKEHLVMVVGISCVWVFLMHFLPLLIMGFRHHRLSKNSCLIIDTDTQTFHYKLKDKLILFRLSEIEKVIKVVSPPAYDERIDVMGFGYFFYWKILLFDGTTLSVSCMLLDEEDFPGMPTHKEKRFFPVPGEAVKAK